MPKGIYKRTKETIEKIRKANIGKHHTEETKQKLREINLGKKMAEKNPMWKGDKVGYGSLHEWIKNRKSKPNFCEECKKKSPHDLANISGKYKRDVNDFKWVCRRCHMLEDGRLKNLHNRLRPYAMQ